MVIDISAVNARNKEIELRKNLEKISRKLIKGDDGSIEALYQLKEILDKLDIFDLSGKINPRLASITWILNEFIHKLWKNLGGDSKGFPKTDGTEILKNIAKYLGVLIQNSLFRNRPSNSIGTFEDVIKSYYELLHITEEYYKKDDPKKEYVVL